MNGPSCRPSSLITHDCTSMIIGNFDLVRVALAPNEANAKLVVDADAMLSASVTPQLLQTVAGRAAKIVQRHRRVQQKQLPLGHLSEVCGRPMAAPACCPELSGLRVRKRFDQRKQA